MTKVKCMQTFDSIEVFKLTQPNIGLFAQLNYCLLLAKHCSERELNPYFFITGKANIDPKYGANCFDYYFSHNLISKEQRILALEKYALDDYYEISNRFELNLMARGDIYKEIQNELTNLYIGNKLFNKYLTINDHVLNTVNDFYANNLLNKKVLGLHYRGLDKYKEATILEYDFVLSIIVSHIKHFDSLFLASDDPEFIEHVQRNIPNKNIITYSRPSGQLHLIDNSNNYQKGFNALVDSLLLSKTNLLIKTPSLLSAWSKIFNPRLPVILLGRPNLFPNNEREIKGYGYYPESVLYQDGFFNKLRNRVKKVRLPTDRN